MGQDFLYIQYNVINVVGMGAGTITRLGASARGHVSPPVSYPGNLHLILYLPPRERESAEEIVF